MAKRSHASTDFVNLASTAQDDEEIAWDEDSDSEPESPSTPQVTINKTTESSDTVPVPPAMSNDNLKPSESRRSNDQQSQADSDASYDLVSGATSRTPGSPKETNNAPAAVAGAKPAEDSSDEEDWE